MSGTHGLLALLLLGAVLLSPIPSAHRPPATSDGLTFTEVVSISNGVGNYSGYTESTYVNGTLEVTATTPGGNDTAHYAYVDSYFNNQGAAFGWSSSGNFTFSADSFLYLVGTDNQTGYTNPYVWFYMDNALAVGGSFYLLNTQMHVTSTNASYPLALSPTGYVATIASQGTGSFQRNDDYGQFNATYAWSANFDPATGYIVGYLYTEQDSDGAGDGFALSDQLHVTSTTFPLTSASAPPAGSSSPGPSPLLWALVAGAVVLVVVVLVLVILRSRRRVALPRHSAYREVGYGPPAGTAPPPIGLIPSQQPAVQQIVMKETVKVNCRYCGALIDTTAAACPNCGAPRS